MIPEMMNAIIAGRPGGPEVLEQVQRPIPMPGAGEVLIRVTGAGVNRPDILQRNGMPLPPGVTDVLGLEVSGTVIALGAGVDAPRQVRRSWPCSTAGVCRLLCGACRTLFIRSGKSASYAGGRRAGSGLYRVA
jgi:NADPH:quinone reductase-like Zn-dependent oxidoreductase